MTFHRVPCPLEDLHPIDLQPQALQTTCPCSGPQRVANPVLGALLSLAVWATSDPVSQAFLYGILHLATGSQALIQLPSAAACPQFPWLPSHLAFFLM